MSTATQTVPTRRAAADAGIPFARLVRVEWRKATDTRAARWLLAVTAVGTIALMLAPLLAKNSIEQSWTVYLQFTAFGLGTLLPVVSILTMTSEWNQRTVLTTFAQEPRRARVVGAKVAVSGLMAVAGIVFGALVTAAALGIASASGRDLNANLDTAHAIGYALFITANIGVGVAFGALLQNTPAAIVLNFVLPTIFGILGAAVASLGRWIDTGTTFNWLVEGDFDGHVPNILASVGLWLVLPLALGVVRTVRREIK